jgi:hypothetical protein
MKKTLVNRTLVEFYTAGGQDCDNRTHNEILSFTDEEFEGCHNFIQWLFPAITASAYNQDAPVLNLPTIDALKGDAIFEAHFMKSIIRILDFWKIKYRKILTFEESSLVIEPIEEILPWMEIDNHNLLRMTRFMESCQLLGFGHIGQSLFQELLRTVKTHPEFYFIEPINVYYWYKAAYGVEI